MLSVIVMGLNENLDGLLDQCFRQLVSFKGINQLLFVDNGSTDDTLDVAEWHGFEIIHHEWDHDHAAARNSGLAHATGDWIIVTDPDELWDDWYVNHLADYLTEHESEGISAYLVPLHNFLGDHHHVNPAWENTHVYRIFRRGLAYSNALHEEPQPIKKAASLEHRLFHMGWSRDHRYLKHKLARRCFHDGVARDLDQLLAMASPVDIKMPSIFNPSSLIMKPEWNWEDYYDESFSPRKERIMSKKPVKKPPQKKHSFQKPYVKPEVVTREATGIRLKFRDGHEEIIGDGIPEELNAIRKVFQNNNSLPEKPLIQTITIGGREYSIGQIILAELLTADKSRSSEEPIDETDLYHARFHDYDDRIVRIETMSLL